MVATAGAQSRVQGFVLDKAWSSHRCHHPGRGGRGSGRGDRAGPPQNRYRAPHFVYAVRREAAELLGDENLLDRGGLVIDTTLDYDGYQRRRREVGAGWPTTWIG